MPITTWAVETPTAQVPPRPEFFRLSRPGHADPYFGFSRSFYYALEARGLLSLVRIRDEGKERGVTIIPYAAVAALVRERMQAQNGQGDVKDPKVKQALSKRAVRGRLV